MAHDKKPMILDAFRGGMTVLEAAELVGISTRTIYRMAQDDPEFREAIDEARDKADDKVEAATFRNVLDPDPAHNSLRMFWLKNRRREVFGEKVTQEITGKDGAAFPGVTVYLPSNGRNGNPAEQ